MWDSGVNLSPESLITEEKNPTLIQYISHLVQNLKLILLSIISCVFIFFNWNETYTYESFEPFHVS